MQTRTKGKYTILHTSTAKAGSCDSSRLREALNELAAKDRKHICVDFTGECIIDSSVIGALVEYHGVLSKTGGGIVVMSPPNKVLEALIRMQINQVIRFVQNESQL